MNSEREGQPEIRLAAVPQAALGPDCAPSYIAFGGMTVDNVITADGQRLIGVCGGNALYSAVGMKVWADDVGIVARVGDDYPPECIDAAADHGLDLHGLRMLNGPHRLRVAFAYRADGSRTRTVPDDMLERVPLAERHHFRDTTFDDSTYLGFSPVVADIPDGWLASAKGMHLPALRFVTHGAVTAHVCHVNPSLTLTMDSPWYEGGDVPGEDLTAVLQRVVAVLPSADDLHAVWPALGPLAAARALQDRGARAVVVKVGEAGSLVLDEAGHAWQVPAFPADAIELTGAGDAYCGGFLVGLGETGDVVTAACYGTVSASIIVESRSPLEAMARVGSVDVESRLAYVSARVSNLGETI